MRRPEILFELFPLLRAVLQTPYLTLDFLGTALFVAGVYFGTDSAFGVIAFTIASTLITVGISLPIAIYYQSEHNAASFLLVRNCESAGIRAVFVNRRSNEDQFRKRADSLAQGSHTINLLGVGFPSLLDPNQNSDSILGKAINTRAVALRILLLDPDSDAARRRAEIEIGGPTISDIQSSIELGIPSTILQRLESVEPAQLDTFHRDWVVASSKSDKDNIVQIVLKLLNIEVRLYESDPMVFLMQFDNGMLVEQYHFGRPQKLVRWGECIGQQLPVLEFRRDAVSYAFMAAHFEYLWQASSPITERLVHKSCELYVLNSPSPPPGTERTSSSETALPPSPP